MKKALITGVTGQDGSYLAEHLLGLGYEVHGTKRRASSFNTERIDHIFRDPHEKSPSFFLHYADLTDFSSVSSVISEIQPDEIYNLAAQSHVGVSFQMPLYTGDVVALGTMRILEAIRRGGLIDKVKFYQASSSELFGEVAEIPQTERTMFLPRSPYAIAKLYAYWATVNYRDAYGLFACNGILFNHESPRRGETFVTRKITRGLSNVLLGLEECLFLGNLNALRDWGHARDYVEMMQLMLQAPTPQDYVIATGHQVSVREFLLLAAKGIGVDLEFRGVGENETAVIKKIDNGEIAQIRKVDDVVVAVDPRYFRPTEVDSLLGDATKAQQILGWTPRTSVEQLATEMIEADFLAAKKRRLLITHEW